MSKTHEKKFTDALRDIFVGARIEGDSGYINLMRMKSRYYTDGVFPRLMEKIDAELETFPNFREELFDKLYSFFKRYFSESGSIYFRHTPYYQDIYERIYTDDRDVMLFWKTQNLYYVKTDRLFRSLTLNLDDAPEQKYAFDASAVAAKSFAFDASGLQNKRNNEKRNLIFEYKGKDNKDDTLKFAVQYAEGAKKTKTDDILKAIKKDGVKVNEDQLTRALRLFERQSEVDFFINKNAKAFLNEQFDLWMYQYLFKNETDFKEKRIKQMQALKRVAYAIIEFISQFEDELVRIWNKPKFAHNSNYIITFDRIFERSEKLARKLLEHKGIKAQIGEWRDLGIIDKSFSVDCIFQLGDDEKPKSKKKQANQTEGLPFDEETIEDVTEIDALPTLSAKYRFLPFDTQYFESLKFEILGLYENLDDNLDGRLIHSENYQALNTLKEKFRERVKCIYIDPPYNTAASEILYQNNYLHSSWMTLIENRLEIADNFVSNDSVICVAIDDFEFSTAKSILNLKFGEENILSTIVVRSNPHGRAMASGFQQNHEYALFYGKSEKSIVGRLPRNEKRQARYSKSDELGAYTWLNFRTTGANSRRSDRPKLFFPLYIDDVGNIRFPEIEWSEVEEAWKPLTKLKKNESVIYPIDSNGDERVWNLGSERVSKVVATDLLAKQVDNIWQIYRKYRPNEDGALPNTWWEDAKYSSTDSGIRILKSLFGERENFSYPKSVFLVADCLRASNAANNSITFDFFAGSGTTAHAVINLNREDRGRRKYILVEANDYFHTVILPRVKKVVFSDKWKDGKAQPEGKGISHFCKYFALEQYEDTLRRSIYLDDSKSDTPSFFNNPYESPFSSYVFLRDKKMSDALQADYKANKIRVDFSKLYDNIDWAETLSCIKGKFIKTQTAESVTFADGETINFNEIDYQDILPLIWWDK